MAGVTWLYRSGGIDYTELVVDRTRTFTGRDWVFQAIDGWLADPRGGRVFFLAGGPGTGKSAIAARLVQAAEGAVVIDGCRHLGAGWLSFYQFCQATYDETLDPLRFVTSLFLHLKERDPAFLPAFWQTVPPDPTVRVEQHVGAVQDHASVIGVMNNIAHLEKLQVGALPARVAFHRLIAAPLKQMAATGTSRPLVILLDALDEALTHPGENLVDLLADIVDDPRDLPPFVRLVVTARPDDRVVDGAGDPALDLLADAPPNADDVRAYAHRRLDDPAESSGASLAGRIADRAAGNFLYARYVIDDLPPLEQLASVDDLPLPEDLHDVYRQFLKRELARRRMGWNAEYAPLLGVLSVAQGAGLTFDQLRGITRLAGNVLENLLLAAGQYLAGPRPNGPFRIYHQSFRDFMLADDKYRVFPADAHGQVAGFFWQAFHPTAQTSPAAASTDSTTYALRHLPLHLAGAGDRARLRELLLDYRWLRARLAEGDVNAASVDYDLAPEDAELRLVAGALRLSAHVVAADPAQLAGQLHGRLLGRPEPGVQALLAGAVASVEGPRLRPTKTLLAAPGGPRLRTLVGHADTVISVAVMPDGRRAVSASHDGMLIVWDVDTGERLRLLEGHGLRVNVVAALPDGRRVVSASDDGTLGVWDVETGEQLRTLAEHRGPIMSVAALLDGRRAVSGSWDGALIVWDVETGERLRTLAGHSGLVRSVTVLPDGRRVVSGSYDGTLIVWDVETGERLRTLEGHTNWVYSVAALPDGRRAVSASWDRSLIVWDVDTGERLRSLQGHTAFALCVAALPDGRRVVSASDDGTMIVWDVETGERLGTLEGHGLGVNAVAALPDARRAVSASSDRTLIVWDVETGERLRTPRGHHGTVKAVAALPDARRAVSGSADGTLIVWDVETGERLHTLKGHDWPVNAVVSLLDGRCAVSGLWDGTLIVWDVETGERLRTLKGHGGAVHSVATLPDGRRAVSGSWDGALIVWDLETGARLRVLEGHDDPVMSVAVLPDGWRAVSASHHRTLIVWDVETGERLSTLEGHNDAVNSVVALPGGRRAVSGSSDGTLIVWDVETGERLRTLAGHSDGVRSVAVLPDGRWVVSGSSDRTLIVWDVETGARVATFTGEAGFMACAVTRDGRMVVAGDHAGGVHFLRIEGLG